MLDSIGKFKAELGSSRTDLEAHAEAFCYQKGIIKICDAVLAASGSGFEGVYLAVWNLIVLVEGGQLELYIQTVRSLNLRAEDGPGRGRAKQKVKDDVSTLYIQAAEAMRGFKTFIKAIGQATGAKVDLPDALQRISRVFEKILFDCKNPGSCEKIADIVRAMLKATSMKQVAKIAIAFLESDEIVIVRIKDRFVEKPSAGGWRDLMINFYLASDPNRHVCEVQVVLEKMLVARKGLGGHIGYGKSRNALEILEMLDVLEPAKRWERASYLREVEGREAAELAALGFETADLVRAGFTEFELSEAGVPGAELATSARQVAEFEADAAQKRNKARVVTRRMSKLTSRVTPAEGSFTFPANTSVGFDIKPPNTSARLGT